MLSAKYVGGEENKGFIKYQIYELQDFYNNRGINVMDTRTCANKSYRDLNDFRRDWIFVSRASYASNKRRISDDQAYFIAATTVSFITMAIVIGLILGG